MKRKDKESLLKRKLTGLLDAFSRPERLRWFILSFLSLVVSVALFPGILSKPHIYKLGDVAERDIKASDNFLIENNALTERNRAKALKEVLAVYDFDMTSSNLLSAIRESFESGREYIDSLSEQATRTEAPAIPDIVPPSNAPGNKEEMANRFFGLLGIPPDPDTFDALLKSGFPSQVEETVIRLTSEITERGIVGNRRMLKDHMEKGGITLHDISSKKEKRALDFDQFYTLESARRLIAGQAKSIRAMIRSPELAQVSVKLAQWLIKPNVTFNQRESELRKDLARKSIKPIYFKIKKGEMLVR